MNMIENNWKIVSIEVGKRQSVSNAEISTKNYVLYSFKLEKDPVFRTSPILGDFRVIRYLYLDKYFFIVNVYVLK
jgi:hypothetical protein